MSRIRRVMTSSLSCSTPRMAARRGSNRIPDVQEFPFGEWGWKIQFLNEEVGFVSLENFTQGAILKTMDGGLTWKRLPINDPQHNANLEGIGFVDEQHGWVGGWGMTRISSGLQQRDV